MNNENALAHETKQELLASYDSFGAELEKAIKVSGITSEQLAEAQALTPERIYQLNDQRRQVLRALKNFTITLERSLIQPFAPSDTEVAVGAGLSLIMRVTRALDAAFVAVDSANPFTQTEIDEACEFMKRFQRAFDLTTERIANYLFARQDPAAPKN
jgi:hypothetical protein